MRADDDEFLWQVMDAAGLEHWQAPVAEVLNRFLGIDAWCESDFADDGIDWLIARTKLLTRPVTDECFVRLLLSAPLLSWSVARGGKRWNVMVQSLDEFLAGVTPFEYGGDVMVWQDAGGPFPSLDVLRAWLLQQAKDVREIQGAG
ncbi:MAG: hypothetical protein KF778_15750 [Rhodocyclaceae bacterium]|nr:hypothetical protein [Rhodocyclaceae bacterium]MBX3669856.1 hypothetical protein [Rhodocyclaceae bacterium]